MRPQLKEDDLKDIDRALDLIEHLLRRTLDKSITLERIACSLGSIATSLEKIAEQGNGNEQKESRDDTK